MKEKISRKYRRFHKNEKKCNISIYYSNEADPIVVDGKPLAAVTIEFDDDDDKLPFMVDFEFGDTQIRAFCKEKQLELKYQEDKENDKKNKK